MAGAGVELCRASDLPELLERFRTWYRFNPRLQERDYFDWQFRNTPCRLAGGDYDFLLLRGAGGEIAGCLGFVGFEFRRGEAIAVGGWTHNWWAENQRDGGFALLSRFLEYVDNRFLLRLNDKSGTVVRLLRVPMLPAMPRWWAAVDAAQVEALFGFTDPADRALLARSAALIRCAAPSGDIAPLARLEPDEEFHLAHLGVTSHARRTGRYLNWRYVDIPRHDYHLIRAGPEFAVYRIETVKGAEASVVRIVEWTLTGPRAGAALALILEAASARNPVLLDFHCTHRPLGLSLERFGFVAQEATVRPMPDLFRPANHSGGYAVAIDLPPHRTARTIDFDDWYITNGDSDIDRVKL